MERMKKIFESRAGKMGEKEKGKWMEQCLTFLEGEGKDKDQGRDDKKRKKRILPQKRTGLPNAARK